MAEMATAPANAAPADRQGALDEMMLSMDVVDTLRHQESLVGRELDETRREAELLDRLRTVYRSQGIDVPDRILVAGVQSLKERRFVYSPPAPGMAVTFAKLWVRRGRIGAVVGGLVGIAAISFLGWSLLVDRPARLAAERGQIEISQTLPAELARMRSSLLAESRTEDARRKTDQLADDAAAAIRSGDAAAARTTLAELQALLREIQLAYQVMVVSRPGEPSGVFRVPDRNRNARNYYLIVEAIGTNGQLLPRTITSEEDGKAATASKWGVRVSRDVYEAVVRDKQDDGIIQNRRLGEKKRGALAVEWSAPMPAGTGGAILNW